MKRHGVVGQWAESQQSDVANKRQSASDIVHVEHQYKADAADVVANDDAKHHLRRRVVRDSGDEVDDQEAAKRCAEGQDCRRQLHRRDVAKQQQQQQQLLEQRREVVSPLLLSHSSCFLLV